VRLLVLLFCSIALFGQSASPTPESKPQAETTSSDQKSRPDFRLGVGARGRQLGGLDILSDTRGVDFGPYLKDVIAVVRQNWYILIPESAQVRKGKLAIEFAITKEGQVADMHLVASSGDIAMDRPAWGSITNSNPFPALPSEFTGQYLALRFRYYYNPDKSELETGRSSGSPELASAHKTDSPLALGNLFCRGSNQEVPGCITPPRQISAPGPKFPKKERKAHHQGTVTLTLVVNPDGAPTNIAVLHSLSYDFDKEAIEAVKRWKFAPAAKDGKPVAVKIAVETAFHLH
jgi:TonB family protein